MKKGSKHTKESLKKMSESIKELGMKPPSRKGTKHTERTKEKLSKSWRNVPRMLGKKHTKEAKEKIRNSHIGIKHPNRKSSGPLSEEHKRKISVANIGKNKGENSAFWQGGKSFEKYGLDWTDTLRESIRKRDNFICQECGIHQDELGGRFKKLDIHHIDYNKYNLEPNNLITLCKSCHAKTNYNREYWIEYFNDLII